MPDVAERGLWRDIAEREGFLMTVASNLRAGDLFCGIASGRGLRHPWPEPMVLHAVTRDLKGRIRVDFGGGVVRTYQPGRDVWVRSESDERNADGNG